MKVAPFYSLLERNRAMDKWGPTSQPEFVIASGDTRRNTHLIQKVPDA